MTFTTEQEYEAEITHLRRRVAHLEDELHDAEQKIERYREALYDVRHTVAVAL